MSRAELQAAVQSLYHNTDSQKREASNVWLEKWQRSEAAWLVCYEVLSSESCDLETCYFAAQTLRTKVLRDFEELPSETGFGLPETLLGLLSRHANAPNAVKTQLCLGIAALVLHIPAAKWSGGGFLESMEQFAAKHGQAGDVMGVILEVLTVVPQEVGTYQPSILPERRRQLQQEMNEALPKALNLLSYWLGTSHEKFLAQTLEAFAAWLRLTSGSGLSASMLNSVFSSGLVQMALRCLEQEGEPFYSAVDAMVELLYCTSDGGSPKAEMASVVQTMVSGIMGLVPRFHVCMQQAVEDLKDSGVVVDSNASEDYEEEAKALARLFAEVGEAYSYLISEASPQVLGPVEALLEVSQYPDMQVSSISFNFWHRMSNILSAGRRPHSLHWEGPVLSEQEAQQRISSFAPAFERLVSSLCGRLQYPKDWGELHGDEKYEFKDMRAAVGDLLLDATDILGPDRTLQLVMAPLTEVSTQVQSGGIFDWRKAESSIYCVRCIHRSALEVKDGSILVSLFSSLPTLPRVVELDCTVALMLGDYSHWLAHAASQNQCDSSLIVSAMHYIIRGLGDEDTSPASSLALKSLCQNCHIFLAGSMQELLDLYRQVQAMGDVALHSQSTSMDEEDVENVLEAVTIVVASLPYEAKRTTVQIMIDSVAQPIQMMLAPVQSNQANPDAGQISLVLPLFERVTTILRNVDDPEDVADILHRFWPWVDTALQVYVHDGAASEKICRVPRYAIRSAKQSTSKSVPLISQALTNKFDQTRHACYLYVASELVKTFGHDSSYDQFLQPMLGSMLTSACQGLGSLQAASSQPDLTDDIFLLAGRGLNYSPRLLMTEHLLSVLIATARNALLIQHREACASVAAFLVRLLDPGTHRKCTEDQVRTLQACFEPQAEIITRLALAGGVGALPSSRIHEMVDVLYALLKSSKDSVAWVKAALSPVPMQAVGPSITYRFYSICQAVVVDEIGEDDERHLLDALAELSEVCRRHHKVQHLVMQALLPPEFQYYNNISA